MTLGTTPLSTVTIGNNQIPASAVAVPNHVSGNLTTLRGANPSTDSNGNETADASVAMPDGANITQGSTTDVAVTGDTAGTVSAKLRGMNKTLAAAFLDTFGNAGNITAATTFSGIPTASQLVTNSRVFLANPGGQSTFLIALEVGSAFNGTISFYGLEPDATSLQLVSAHQRGATTIATSSAISTGAALNQIWVGNIANFKGVYAVCTTFTSGTLSAQLGLSPAPYAVSITNTANVSVTNANANGQSTMAGSAPIVIASDQTAIAIKRSTTAIFTQASGATSGSTQNSGDLTVGQYTEISIDITTTAQSGTSPTIQYFYERKGADGLYYVLWQTNVLTLAANTISTSIGTGVAYNQSLGLTGRLRWVVGGSATPTYTHSLNIYAK